MFRKKSRRRSRHFWQIVGVWSVVFASLAVFRGDFERECIPHSYFPLLQQEFQALKKSYDDQQWLNASTERSYQDEQVNIAFVSCGGGKSRLNEVRSFLYSAALASRSRPLHFIAFTDNLASEIEQIVSQLDAARIFPKLTLDLRQPNYPDLKDLSDLTSAFAPCASLRLFFPALLGDDYSRLLYVDTDVLFLGDPADLFDRFKTFEPRQVAALVNENLDDYYSLYSFSFIPSPPHGLNSGVMLMDLGKMSATKWQEKVLIAYAKLKKHLAFVDQDLLNLLFHSFPEELHVLPCSANFRPDLCLSAASCPDLGRSSSAPLVLHGNRGVCQVGWPFGSAAKYLARTAWWFSFNLGYVPYSVRINPVVTTEQRLFRRVYRFFQELRVEEFASAGEIRSAFEDAIRRPGLEGDLCYHVAEDVIKAVLAS